MENLVLEYLNCFNFDNKVRCGIPVDGGYVIGDINETYDCYISAGINNEDSFTTDFISKYNMNNNYAFDGTIDDYPYQYTKNITFIKKNINSYNDDFNDNLQFLFEKYNNIFLKMDIEGGEYPWLLSIDDNKLNKLKQIVIEFHGITKEGLHWGTEYDDKIKCFKKLADTHYLIHAHSNNNSQTFNKIPDTIELTYINKKYFTITPELNTTPLPIPNLDFPNNPYSKDHDLNFYPFVNNI